MPVLPSMKWGHATLTSMALCTSHTARWGCHPRHLVLWDLDTHSFWSFCFCSASGGTPSGTGPPSPPVHPPSSPLCWKGKLQP